MAAIFALSLVPSGAWAENTNSDHGEMDKTGASGSGLGTIYIANTKTDETYNVYRIFDLASFNDSNNSAGVHKPSTSQSTSGEPAVTSYDGEAYSYVIRQYVGDENAENKVTNPWWTFLMGANASPTGAVQAVPVQFAKLKNTDSGYDPTRDNEGATAGQYFWIEPEPITLVDAAGDTHTDYHVVTATKLFPNAWDVSTDYNEVDSTNHTGTFPHDGTDYVQPNPDNKSTTSEASIKTVQDFAQRALAYAQKLTGTPQTAQIAPNYVEKGVASGGTVTVNGANTTMNETDKTTFKDVAGLAEKGGHVPLGWYLVGSTMGTLASLDTTNSEVTIYNKNEVPTIEKKVLKKGATASVGTGANGGFADMASYYRYLVGNTSTGDTVGSWVDNTDADINDLVLFRTVVNAKQGAKDYKIHDVMEPGLTLLHQTIDNNTQTVATAARLPRDDSNNLIANTDGYLDTSSTDSAKVAFDTMEKDPNNSDKTGPYDIKVFHVRAAADQGSNPTITEIPYSVTVTSGTNVSSGNYNNWTLTLSASVNDNCTFEIALNDATKDPHTPTGGDLDEKVTFVTSTSGDTVDIKDDDKIVVLYWAYLDNDAVVYGCDDATHDANNVTEVHSNDDATEALLKGDGSAEKFAQKNTDTDKDGRNTNSTILTYGAKSHTDWDEAEVTTYPFEIVKTQVGNGETSAVDETFNLLNGAKFSLYKATTDEDDPKKIAETPDLNAAIGAGGYRPVSSGNTYFQASKALSFTKAADTQASEGNVRNPHPSYRFNGDQATGRKEETTELVSDFDEVIRVYGLDAGDYILVEDKAPEGFNKLAHPIVIHVNGDLNKVGALDYDGVDRYDTNGKPSAEGTKTSEGRLNVYAVGNDSTVRSDQTVDWQAHALTGTNVNASPDPATAENPAKYPKNWDDDEKPETTKVTNGGVQVINQTGAELPSTGGIGTTIFYVAGTVLVVGAAVMLVAKRRMGAEA